MVDWGKLVRIPEYTHVTPPGTFFTRLKSDKLLSRPLWNGRNLKLLLEPRPRLCLPDLAQSIDHVFVRSLLAPEPLYLIGIDLKQQNPKHCL